MVLLASSPDGQAAADAAHGESGLGQGRAEASSIKESYVHLDDEYFPEFVLIKANRNRDVCV